MTDESAAVAPNMPSSEVSFTAELLRHLGVIDYGRGRVIILGREKRESQACEYSGVIHGDFLSLY